MFSSISSLLEETRQLPPKNLLLKSTYALTRTVFDISIKSNWARCKAISVAIVHNVGL